MLSTIKIIQFHAKREKNFWLFTENVVSHCRDLGIYCPATAYVSLKQLEVTEKSYRGSLPLSLLSSESWMFVKESPHRKKNETSTHEPWVNKQYFMKSKNT